MGLGAAPLAWLPGFALSKSLIWSFRSARVGTDHGSNWPHVSTVIGTHTLPVFGCAQNGLCGHPPTRRKRRVRRRAKQCAVCGGHEP